MDGHSDWIALSERIPGWTRGEEAAELVRLSGALQGDPALVEIGSFLGSGAVLLAGPRKDQGSGRVHCVDTFDCGGDAFSVPFYERIVAEAGGGTARAIFDRNVAAAGLADWIEVHQGDAASVAAGWSVPIDLLFLDADQSEEGASAVFDAWTPHLRPGGVLALHNSYHDYHRDGHDGFSRIARREFGSPRWRDGRLVGSTTILVKR